MDSATPVPISPRPASNVSRYLVNAVPLWLLLFLCMLTYVLLLIEPSITGVNWWSNCVHGDGPCTRFLPDSPLYLHQADNFTLSDIDGAAMSILPYKGALLYWQAQLAATILPHWQYSLIFVMNFALFLAVVALLMDTADALKVDLPPVALALTLFNPYVLLLVLTLNKDIWAFLVVAGGAWAAARRSTAWLLCFMVLGLFARDILTVMIVCSFFASRSDKRMVLLFVGCALAVNALPFVPQAAELLELRSQLPDLLGLNTAWLWSMLCTIQTKVPLGQLLTFPITLGVNVVADGVSPSTWGEIVKEAPVMYVVTAFSSLMFTFVALRLYFLERPWTEAQRFFLRHGLVLSFLVSLYPILHHRYYLIAYLFFALAAFGRRKGASC